MEHQAGIPVLMQPLSGNSHDGKAFGQVIRDHIAQLHPTANPTYLVADSALYSAENLHKLAETSLKWITRVPATLTKPRPSWPRPLLRPWRRSRRAIALTSCHRAMGASRNAGSSSTPSTRQPQAQRTVDKQWRKQSDHEVKAFQTLCRTAFACEADAQQALARFAARLADHVSPRQHRLPHAPLWEAGAPRPWRPARPDRLPYRRSPGVSAHGPSGACRPAQLFYPRHERTGRGPVASARRCWPDTKGKPGRNAGFASSKTRSFWPPPSISKSLNASWPC